MLDVAIGLLVLFFGLASVCSFVHERIASLLSLRQRNFYRALQSMLEPSPDPLRSNDGFLKRVARDFTGTLGPFIARLWRGRPSNCVDLLLQMPQIKAQRGRGWWGTMLRPSPSWLPREMFVDAAKRLGRDMSSGMSEDAYKIINELDDKGIGDWFDATMERSRGWYRRQTQVLLIIIATVLVVAFNIDALAIADTIARNKTLRDTLALQIERRAPDAGTADTIDAVTELLAQHDIALNLTPRCEAVDDAGQTVKLGLVSCIWTGLGRRVDEAPRHALGWLFSILAACVGAPFWFDLIGRFVSLRSSASASSSGGGTVVAIAGAPASVTGSGGSSSAAAGGVAAGGASTEREHG